MMPPLLKELLFERSVPVHAFCSYHVSSIFRRSGEKKTDVRDKSERSLRKCCPALSTNTSVFREIGMELF
jgi:hypothetical protein